MTLLYDFSIVAFSVLFSFCFLFLVHQWHGGKPALPPGPPTLPLVGNLHQIPTKDIWEYYRDLHQKYGPLISMEYGQNVVISIGSFKVAKDLLSKRGLKYASRPQFIATSYTHRMHNPALIPSGKKLAIHQALQKAVLHGSKLKGYQHVQDLESRQLLHEIVHRKNISFQKLIHRYTFSTSLTLVYGERLHDVNDELLEVLTRHIDTLARKIQGPSGIILEAFPILDWLPRGLAPWKTEGDMLYIQALEKFESLTLFGASKSSWNWSKHLMQLNRERYLLQREEIVFAIGSLLEASE